MHFVAQSLGKFDSDFPVSQSRHRWHGLAHPRDTSLSVGEGAVFFQERRTRQKHMGVFGGFIQENVLHHDAFHGGQSGCHMLRIGIGLHDVFALAVQTQEGTVHGRVKHIGNAQTRLWTDADAPSALKQAARGGVRNVAIAWQLVREAAHVTRTLHIVLTTQGVHTHAFTSHHATGHGQVGNAHHHGRAL